jgi:hypothetical protein
MKISRGMIFVFIIITVLLVECNKSSPTGPTGPVTFTVCPIDTARIFRATPLGNLNPPGHVFPTSHIGFYLNGSSLVAVHSIADCEIRDVYHNTSFDDYRVECKHSDTFFSIFDHLKNLPTGIVIGASVSSGEIIGYGDRNSSAVDLGVVDYDITRYFVISERYGEFDIHCGNPYLYFTDSIQTMLYAKNPRTAEPRGGKIDFDIDGGLSGNWFLEGTPVTWEASSWIY